MAGKAGEEERSRCAGDAGRTDHDDGEPVGTARGMVVDRIGAVVGGRDRDGGRRVAFKPAEIAGSWGSLGTGSEFPNAGSQVVDLVL